MDCIALVYDDAATGTISVTAIAARSLNEAATMISEKKSKAMHIYIDDQCECNEGSRGRSNEAETCMR